MVRYAFLKAWSLPLESLSAAGATHDGEIPAAGCDVRIANIIEQWSGRPAIQGRASKGPNADP